MKASLHWMREFAPLDAPLQRLAGALVDTGTEVVAVHRLAEGAVVARVVALQPVPETTRRPLLITDLDVGGAEPVRLLTGATNLRVGDLVPYAPPGTLLPGWDEPLGVRTMLGRYSSPGMLCSPAELQAGPEGDGIMVLERGLPGQAVHEVLDLDAILDVEVTPNRPDCLAQLGIARELAAALGETVTAPPHEVPEALLSAASSAERLSVRVEDPRGCPRFCACIIENVAVGPSPEWLRWRLRAVGVRPINNVVDVTNYVTAELGQPLHAFDLDLFERAAGTGSADVVVRRGRDDRVLCLDGVERRLGPEDMAVCAGDRAVSIAGIIGGRDTAVGEGTRAVLLESASWEGPRIRATSRRVGVRTEASAHFEKGLSDTLPPLALARAAALIAELGSGRVLRGVADEHDGALPPPPVIDVPEGFLDRVLGYTVDASEAATALARLGFLVEQEGGSLRVVPPHWRRDVCIAVDVVEEVGRSLGYGRVPSTLPGRRTAVGALAPSFLAEDRVRDVCVGAGLDEVITYSFVSPEAAARLPGLGGTRRPIPLLNPLTEEWSVLRTSVLPGMCAALAANLRQQMQAVSIFELGRVFWEGERRHPPLGSTPDGADRGSPPLPAEPLMLGLLSQTGDGDGTVAQARLRHLQAVLAWLCHELAGSTLRVEPGMIDGFRDGRAGAMVVDGGEVGVIGELDDRVVEAFDLRGRVAVAELRVDALVPGQARPPRFRTPPRLPAVIEDLAVVVDDAAQAGDALATIRSAGGQLLEAVDLYDEYRGARLGEGRKGWTFRMTYRDPDRTLTSSEAHEAHQRIAAALRARLGAEVRR